MASVASLLTQSILSALVGSPDLKTQNPCNATDTTNSTESTMPGSIGTPASIPNLMASLLSVSALRDWFKLLVIGGALEFCRRSLVNGYHTVYNWFFITAVFMEDDASYDWIMVWLSKQPSWTNARDVQISTKSFGLNSNAILVPGEEEEDTSLAVSRDRPLSYIPSLATSHTFWYNRRWCRVSRLQRESGAFYKTKEEYLELCILSWEQRVLNELLLEAKKAYKAAQEDKISIYTSELHNGWRHITSRPKRPLSSIVLDPGVKDELLDDARDFLENKRWYSVRGIPFRRGYLLYGAPGSGKTSIIHSLAGELGLDIYIVSLSRSGLDDNSLNEIISELPEQCIALMEDIDAAFTTPMQRRDLDGDEKPDGDGPSSKPSTPKPEEQQQRVTKITLSGLLNALDGVAAQEGRLLFATTNKYEALDPALTRPGRMDLHIEFKLASKYQAREIYRCFFLPDSELIAEAEARAKKARSHQISEDKDTKDGVKEDSLIDADEVDSSVSETSTAVPSTPPSIPPSPSGKHISLPDATFPLSSPNPSDDSTSHSRRRSKAPILSKEEVNRLATEFANVLPEREFSMASLQGYLMAYKTRPLEAVSCFAGWIEKERRERKKKNHEEKEEKEREREIQRRAESEKEENKVQIQKNAETDAGSNTKLEGKAEIGTQTTAA